MTTSDLTARRWDAVVVGAGHNGLTAAAYLARAGRSVLVLERRDQVGGACTLEEPWPGYTISPCAYLAGLLHPLVVEELALHRHGYELIPLRPEDPYITVPREDGSAFTEWIDEDRTVAELGEADGRGYREYIALTARIRDALRPEGPDDLWLADPPSRELDRGPPRRRRGRDRHAVRGLLHDAARALLLRAGDRRARGPGRDRDVRLAARPRHGLDRLAPLERPAHGLSRRLDLRARRDGPRVVRARRRGARGGRRDRDRRAGGRDPPRRGRRARGRHARGGADGRLQRRPAAGAGAARRRGAARLPRARRGRAVREPGAEGQLRARGHPALPAGRPRHARDGQRDRRRRRAATARAAPPRPAGSPTSCGASCTSRPWPTRAWPRTGATS